MIKLIATDMDGTLLDENGHLPNSFTDVLDQLRYNNIKLVAASGRPYYTLQTNFGPMGKYLSYICENGALVIDNNKIIYKSLIDKKIVQEILTEAKKDKSNAIVVCTPNSAYTEKCSDEYSYEIKKYFTVLNIVDDLNKIDEDIIKISICNLDGSDKISVDEFNDDLHIVSSSPVWIDILNKGVNKGVALKNFMDTHNFTKEETMVFGDYYNDIEMLQLTDNSFVMESAPEDMKQYGNYIAASNAEHGVLKAIQEYAL